MRYNDPKRHKMKCRLLTSREASHLEQKLVRTLKRV